MYSRVDMRTIATPLTNLKPKGPFTHTLRVAARCGSKTQETFYHQIHPLTF